MDTQETRLRTFQISSLTRPRSPVGNTNRQCCLVFSTPLHPQNELPEVLGSLGPRFFMRGDLDRRDGPLRVAPPTVRRPTTMAVAWVFLGVLAREEQVSPPFQLAFRQAGGSRGDPDTSRIWDLTGLDCQIWPSCIF